MIAKLFNINLIEEKTVIKEVVKIIVKEIPVEKEVIKKVFVEVPSEKVIELTYKYDGDLKVNGNLVVTGFLEVDKEVTCYKISNK